MAISSELGPKVPFCPMVGSEVYSAEVKPTGMAAHALFPLLLLFLFRLTLVGLFLRVRLLPQRC